MARATPPRYDRAMTNPAPMPRWYDIPVVWLGAQLLALIGIVALVRWLLPDVQETTQAALADGAIVLGAIASYVLQRRLRIRDDADRTGP